MAEEWPWQYDFPPFFTIQPNSETRRKQLEGWRNLILNYFKTKKSFVLDIQEVQDSPLFSNSSIKRKLPLEGIHIVLEDLHKHGCIEWTDKQKKRCFVYWRSPEEWAQLIYAWAKGAGLTGGVCTFHEILAGDDTTDQEFYGLNEQILIKALRCLESQQKAEIMIYDGSEGVKFF